MLENKQKILKFPKGFLWGVSTAAYQIEGGIYNDWSEWEKSEARKRELEKNSKKHANFVAGLACDSYNKYKEDSDLAKKLNCNAYRFGIEWARIEPEKGKWSEKGVEHYREVLQDLKKKDLKIVLTLWHWTNPIWFSEEGGWANKKAVDYFSRYVKFVVNELGDLVDYWITLNEPMVHISNGYLVGIFPPNKKSPVKAYQVFKNLVKAHKVGYKIIHKRFSDAKVSFTNLTNFFEPARKWCLVEVLFAKLADWFWNGSFPRRTKGYFDYIGLDYYFHDRIVWYPPFKKNKNQEVTDMGWEIYPEGIYWSLKSLSKFGKPIIIIENGLADADDKKRADFIINHLKYVHQAISDGIDVRGYFHWSLIDNFEWAEGFDPKFGLYKVDQKTCQRIARPSAKVYAEICKSNIIKISKL
ncbi:MAG: glycoside hydrolase family 1 protein [Patescibacteria group bacterium]